MSNLILNDNVIGGSSNDSSDILYTPNDNRVETNVQAELDRINTQLTSNKKYNEWEDVTNQCVIDTSITWGACIVKDDGYKYRITFTVGLPAGGLTTRLTLPKKILERCILPIIGDNGAGTPTNSTGNVVCMGNTNTIQMSSSGTAYYSQTFDLYHE